MWWVSYILLSSDLCNELAELIDCCVQYGTSDAPCGDTEVEKALVALLADTLCLLYEKTFDLHFYYSFPLLFSVDYIIAP